MSNAASYDQADYSRNRRRHGLGWVPWVALALLALIIAASLLISRNASDTGDQAGVDLTNDPSGQATPAPAAGATGSAGGSGSATAGQTGIYTSTGTDVLAASGSEVGALAGSAINGNNVTVRSVVADEGFWVSSGGSEQMYVYLSQQARSGESAPQVRAGQRVDFAGTLARVPANVGDLGLTSSEGASQLRSQGVFVDATSFRIR